MKKVLITFILIASAISLSANSIVITTDSSTANKSKRYTHTLLLNGIWAKQTQGMGVKYIGFFQLKNNERVLVGPSVFLEKIIFRKEIALPTNVVEAKIGFITPGVEVAYRFNKLVVAQMGFSFLFGQEQIKKIYYYNSNPNFKEPPIIESTFKTKEAVVTGAQLEQSVFYQPVSQEKYNIKIGVGMFERFINASFYESDFGGKIYAGFCF